MWKPIAFDNLYDKIIATESQLMGEMEYTIAVESFGIGDTK